MALTFSEESHLLSKGTPKMALFHYAFGAQGEIFGVTFRSIQFAGFVKTNSWRFCFGGIDKAIHQKRTHNKRWNITVYATQTRLYILSLYSFGHFYVD